MSVISRIMVVLATTLLLSCNRMIAANEDSQWINAFKNAQDAYRRGDLQSAEKSFLQTTKSAKELYGVNTEKYLESLKRLAWVFEEEEKYAEARMVISKMKEFSAEKQMQFKATQLLAYAPVAQMKALEAQAQGIVKGPEAALKAGLKALEPYIGPADPGLLCLYKGLAQTREVDGHYAEAEDVRIKIVSIREYTQGPESVGVADDRVALADLYLTWGKDVMAKSRYTDAERTFAEAKDSYQIAIKLYEQLFGPNYNAIVPTKQTGRVYSTSGRSQTEDTIRGYGTGSSGEPGEIIQPALTAGGGKCTGTP